MADPGLISQVELMTMRSHDLRESIVRQAVAGFLAAELRELHGVDISRDILFQALAGYVFAIDTLLDDAVIELNDRIRNLAR